MKDVTIGSTTFGVEGDQVMYFSNGCANLEALVQNLWSAICEIQVDMHSIDVHDRSMEGPTKRLHSVLHKNDRPLAWAALEAAGES